MKLQRYTPTGACADDGPFVAYADLVPLLCAREVLRRIVHEFDQTYDAECDEGSWRDAASIPAETMECARRALEQTEEVGR